jgi:ADP-ribosyl-[dinitrogen reductase] hydrolase
LRGRFTSAASKNVCSAVLLAANLGGDADTTAAIAGQLAGALYGASAIPPEWLDKLAWRPRIEGMARALLAEAARSTETSR